MIAIDGRTTTEQLMASAKFMSQKFYFATSGESLSLKKRDGTKQPRATPMMFVNTPTAVAIIRSLSGNQSADIFEGALHRNG
jgi:hypothetical protein